ncbi:MAG TPA: hypothetical protein VGJ84_05050, partial [Polyangiaceae bacterium]
VHWHDAGMFELPYDANLFGETDERFRARPIAAQTLDGNAPADVVIVDQDHLTNASLAERPDALEARARDHLGSGIWTDAPREHRRAHR